MVRRNRKMDGIEKEKDVGVDTHASVGIFDIVTKPITT